ncbi:MAG: GYD domain-containing protein [archaeon]|nr:GYD domain-containing protein [archaeon]MDI6884861.1 GYD domain-containing protein [archaeon]
MGVYVMLVTLTEKGRKVIRDKPEKIKEVNEEMERMGVNIVSQYAVFGPFDFVNLLKAESDELVMRLAIEMTAEGLMNVQTLPAIHIDRYLESLKK